MKKQTVEKTGQTSLNMDILHKYGERTNINISLDLNRCLLYPKRTYYLFTLDIYVLNVIGFINKYFAKINVCISQQ